MLIDGRPDLHKLAFLESSNHTVKVIESTAPIWKKLALALEFPQHKIDIIQTDNNNRCEDACRDMLEKWLNGIRETLQPVTWRTLIDALQKCDQCELAKSLDLLNALQ